MDISRLRQGEQIAGISAILLFIFMFFDWFGVKVSGAGVTVESAGGGNAWDALDIIPWILIIAIIAVLAMVVVRANNADVDTPVSLSVIATALAALATLLILYRIINPPDIDGSFGGVEVDVTRKFGLWISFIAAAAMTYGSWRTMEEEGTSFGEAADRLGGGGGGDVGGPGAPGGGGGGYEPPPAEPPAAPPPPPPPPSAPPPSN
jgi:hypothetical protein